MTGVGHDPWRSHVPGDGTRTSLRDEQTPGRGSYPESVLADMADALTVEDLAVWCVDHPGGTPHVLAALDALVGV